MSDDELTIKQKTWLLEYFKTGNATKAALIAYDTKDPSSAGHIGWENYRKLQEPVRMMMEAKGISLGRLIDVLDEGLGATRTISIVSGKQANGGTVDFEDVPDYMARHKYLETAARWLGIDKQDDTKLEVKMQVNFLDYGTKRDTPALAEDSNNGQS